MDVGIRYVLEIFHERAERIAMRGDENVLALLEFGQDRGFEIGDDAIMHHLQGLAARNVDIPAAAQRLERFIADLLFHFPFIFPV